MKIKAKIKKIMKNTHATSCHTKQKPRCECGIEEIEDQLFFLFKEKECSCCCHHSHCECMREEGCEHCN